MAVGQCQSQSHSPVTVSATRHVYCTRSYEVSGTVAYPAAKDDSSTAICLGVPRFAAGALPWHAAGLRIPWDPTLPYLLTRESMGAT